MQLEIGLLCFDLNIREVIKFHSQVLKTFETVVNKSPINEMFKMA